MFDLADIILKDNPFKCSIKGLHFLLVFIRVQK